MSTTKTWKKKIEKIAQNILDADERMKGWEDNLEINNKNLELCCVEHASWLAYYDEIAAELKYTVDFVEMIENQVRGELFKYIKDTSQKAYTDSAINMVVDANPDFLEVHELLLMAQEQYMKCIKVVKAFESRSYMLNNIVKIREKELEHVVIRT